MNIYDGLRLDIGKKEVLSFVGGGGKTTTIFKLGQELKALGKKVLITTTTAIYNPKEGEYDYYFLGRYEEDFHPKEGSITILGREVRQGKLRGLSLAHMDEVILEGLFDFILIEADGAKNKPIKAMASHEPVVSKYSTRTIGIIGIDCLGQPIERIVHRPGLFVDIVGKDLQQQVDQKDMVKIALHPRGLFKSAIGNKILVLNKVGDQDTLMKGYSIRKELLEKGFEGSIILADIQSGSFY